MLTRAGVPAEVLFDRICRHNGITHLLTKVRSPTTTGKIERWHQSIQTDLLEDHGPFADLHEAQDVIEGWRVEYNTVRPHQSLDMATPAERFRPIPSEQRDMLTLWKPPDLAPATHRDGPDDAPITAFDDPSPELVSSGAVELDRVVPACGNLNVRRQQFSLGPRIAGQTVRIWIDTTTAHVSVSGQHWKTLPSRPSSLDLEKLRAEGANRPDRPRRDLPPRTWPPVRRWRSSAWSTPAATFPLLATMFRWVRSGLADVSRFDSSSSSPTWSLTGC